jgi:phenylacetic acid degradation protein PaaD
VERTERITANLAADPYAALLGIGLVAVGDTSVVVSMPVGADHENFLGGTHGGALFSVADCAFSLASNAYDEPAVAVDTHLAITAPTAAGDTLTATAVEVHRGRTLATYRVEVTRDDGRVCGHFTGTVYIKS